jgi:hypothetical protein
MYNAAKQTSGPASNRGLATALQGGHTVNDDGNGAREHEERSRALAVISTEYPGWTAWPAVLAGLMYARYPRSSPPLCVRSTSLDGLRERIEEAEKERGLR